MLYSNSALHVWKPVGLPRCRWLPNLVVLVQP